MPVSDCCDGTDESGDVGCPNTCDELGRAAREAAEQATRLAKDGYQKRLEMSQQGKATRQAKEEERSRLETEHKQAESLKEEKLKLKEVAEAPEKAALAEYQRVEDERKQREDEEEKRKSEAEAIEMFELIDSDGDGKITVVEIQARATFDRNKDGSVSEEEASFFLNLEQEMSREEFLKSGWLIAKPYFLMEKGMFIPPDAPEETTEGSDSGESPSEGDAPGDDPETEGHDDDHDFEDDEAEDAGEALPSPHEERKREREEERDRYKESNKPKYDEPTMELIRGTIQLF